LQRSTGHSARVHATATDAHRRDSFQSVRILRYIKNIETTVLTNTIQIISILKSTATNATAASKTRGMSQEIFDASEKSQADEGTQNVGGFLWRQISETQKITDRVPLAGRRHSLGVDRSQLKIVNSRPFAVDLKIVNGNSDRA
jgi:hypothetical protein